jgi:3-oxoacyl-[acyl-carrier protein] reductase
MVHNATSRRSSEPDQIADLDAAVWEDHAAVSLRGAFHCAQAALPHLRASGGRLVLFTSPAGMDGSAMLPAYSIVKGAVRGLAKSLAREWAPIGVTVAVVSPLAETPALTAAFEHDPAMEARLAARVPMGRIGDPETDIGAVVAFLIGPGAGYITGQTIVVDGGRFMGL